MFRELGCLRFCPILVFREFFSVKFRGRFSCIISVCRVDRGFVQTSVRSRCLSSISDALRVVYFLVHSGLDKWTSPPVM